MVSRVIKKLKLVQVNKIILNNNGTNLVKPHILCGDLARAKTRAERKWSLDYGRLEKEIFYSRCKCAYCSITCFLIRFANVGVFMGKYDWFHEKAIKNVLVIIGIIIVALIIANIGYFLFNKFF